MTSRVQRDGLEDRPSPLWGRSNRSTSEFDVDGEGTGLNLVSFFQPPPTHPGPPQDGGDGAEPLSLGKAAEGSGLEDGCRDPESAESGDSVTANRRTHKGGGGTQ